MEQLEATGARSTPEPEGEEEASQAMAGQSPEGNSQPVAAEEAHEEMAVPVPQTTTPTAPVAEGPSPTVFHLILALA